MSRFDWRDYVVSDAEVLGGRPVVRGTRIAAEEVLEAVERCEDLEGVLAAYPQLTREAVLAVIQFRLAAQYVRERKHMQRRGPMAPGPG